MLPFPATIAVLRRGQERFNIYCTPCHSRVGNGLGEIVQRGYKPAGELERPGAQVAAAFALFLCHDPRLRSDAGLLGAVDSGRSLGGGGLCARTLQLSQAASEQDVPAGVQVKSLKDVAASQNLPASYAAPWTLPSTAVQAYPPDTKQGTPAMAPANPVDPAITIPNKPAACADESTGQRGSKVRSQGKGMDMAHETHAKTLPRRVGRSGICRCMEDARLAGRSGLLGDCSLAGYRGPVDRPRAARMAAGADADLWIFSGRSGAVDGSILLGRASGACCYGVLWRR